jgi:hypothetical protein
MASAVLESGLNPAAKASTSSASGLFQFTEQTWLSTVRQYGAAHGLGAEAAAIVPQGGQLTVADPAQKQRILNLRFDPAVSATMAGDHLRGLAATLTTTLGRAPDAAETYLAHFLGTGGATQMLQAAQTTPGQPAAAVLPEAARANRAAFTAPDGTPRTAAQFVQHIHDRVARAFLEIGATAPQGTLAFSGAGSASSPVVAVAGLGSGVGLARASATAPERAMTASLIDVFTRLDKENHASQTAHGKREHTLPFGLVSALATAADAGTSGAGTTG